MHPFGFFRPKQIFSPKTLKPENPLNPFKPCVLLRVPMCAYVVHTCGDAAASMGPYQGIDPGIDRVLRVEVGLNPLPWLVVRGCGLLMESRGSLVAQVLPTVSARV
jgi:hypothetical protein